MRRRDIVEGMTVRCQAVKTEGYPARTGTVDNTDDEGYVVVKTRDERRWDYLPRELSPLKKPKTKK